MKLDKEQIDNFKKANFPIFRPTKKYPNSFSGNANKLSQIKQYGGLLFKRGKDTFFFKEDEITLQKPKITNTYSIAPWKAAYHIPLKYRK